MHTNPCEIVGFTFYRWIGFTFILDIEALNIFYAHLLTT